MTRNYRSSSVGGSELDHLLETRQSTTQLLYTISRLSTHLVGSLLRTLDPDGILYWSDLSRIEFTRALNQLAEGNPYYSPAVVPHLRKQIIHSECIDLTNRRLLYHLGRGARTKDLPGLLALSLPSIEKRKRSLRNFFTDCANDFDMVEQARHYGLI